MVESRRHLLDLEVELARFDDGKNYRDSRHAVPRSVDLQRPRSGPQARSLNDDRSPLERILDFIPSPHQELQVIPSRLPARRDGYVGRPFPPRVTQIEAVALPGASRLALIHARKTNEWRNYAAASCFGAVIGISSYIFLVEGGAAKEEPVKALTSTPKTAKTEAARSPASDAAFSGQTSNQLGHGYGASAPGLYKATAQLSDYPVLERAPAELNHSAAAAPAVFETMAQPSDDALFERASNQLNHGDVAGARSVYETLAQRGSSRGAFGLAETYDPIFCARHRIEGLKPDLSLARLWYERAAKLGSLEAPQRLKMVNKAISSAAGKPATASVSSASGVLRR